VISFTIGGKERQMKFGTLGISLIEEELGISFLRDVGTIFQKIQIRGILALLRGCLVHSEPNLTKTEAAELLDQVIAEGKVLELINAMNEALTDSGLFAGAKEKTQKKTSGKK